MSEQKTTQAGRRGFLKLVTTGLPVAAVAAAAGTQALASSEVEIRQDSGLRKNAHYKKYLETTRF
ncbi:MAG: twin-arginine translocation pathway signal protein [Gammaproteobacteria bacterium]|nr:twin-arginine translocation pathway signal protein [Gammaproteobacteria bacterium]OUX75576.1 MAG: hypothetical protein CBC19_11140 [Oceanospirillales bacterium TMED59]